MGTGMGRKLDFSQLSGPAAAPQLTEQQLQETTWRDRINRAHSQVQVAEAAALPYAREAGAVLLEVKAGLNHGEFIPWLEANCTVTPRQARNYMAIAANWAAIEDFQKRNRGSVLSIKGALGVLRAPAALPAAEAEAPAPPPFRRVAGLRLPAAQADKLEAIAQHRGTTPAQVAADVMQSWLKRQPMPEGTVTIDATAQAAE